MGDNSKKTDDKNNKTTDGFAYRKLAEELRRAEKTAAEIKANVLEKEKRASIEARVAIGEARRAYSRAEKLPHTLFCPGRLAPYGDAVKEAESLMSNGLSEASAAVSISARFGIERLCRDIGALRAEWDECFVSLRDKTDALREKLRGSLSEWGERFTEYGGGDERALIDMDYWSRGEFSGAENEAREYERYTHAVKKMGEDSYLFSRGAKTSDELRRFASRADKLSGNLDDICRLASERLLASRERERWGEEAAELLRDALGMTLIEEESGWYADEREIESERFRKYAAQTYGGDVAEDVRERMTLIFERAGTRLTLYMAPAEKGGHVSNSVSMRAESAGERDETLEHEAAAQMARITKRAAEDGRLYPKKPLIANKGQG
ncbi:hypothetical protein FACS1894167_15300 [Synergistales bacterium]|nr:hypothetical protein FACS1894167_15300 [Synergistales bacterium]